MVRRQKKRERVSARRRVDEHTGGFSLTICSVPEGMQLYKPKAGTRKIEIIPFTVGEGNKYADPGSIYYERTFFSHRNIGPDEMPFVCPKKTNGDPCPICEYRTKLTQDPDADEDLVKSLAPKERQLWLVYDHAEADKGLQLWEVSHHLFGKKLDTEIRNADEEDGYEFFADPEDGLTLRVTFEDVSRGGYSFLEASSIHFKPRRTEIPDEIFENAPCLDDLLVVKDYDELKKIFIEEPDDDDEDEDDEEPPKGKSRSSKSRSGRSSKSSRTSSSGSGKGRTRKDADEDEEEEKPSSKSRSSRKKTSSRKKKATAEEKGIDIDDFVVVDGEEGEFEVTGISKDGTTLTVEDEDGEESEISVADCRLADDADEEEEEEKRPPRKTSSSKSKSSSRKSSKKEEDDEEEDEDDEEEDEEEEEEEEDRPKTRRGSARKRSRSRKDEDDDEEEEEDDEEEEEEEDRPRRRRSRRAKK